MFNAKVFYAKHKNRFQLNYGCKYKQKGEVEEGREGWKRKAHKC